MSAVEIEELSEAEQSDRLHLERRVERAFFEAGKALAEVRDRRLYGSTYKTFEEYRLETQMTPAAIATPHQESPLLFEGVTWREFKAKDNYSNRLIFLFNIFNAGFPF